jgi:hypothetical protein
MARRADNYAPQLIAGGYAIVGVLIGLLLAIVALTARAVAANLLATSAWIWALAVTAGVATAAKGRDVSTAPLAIWHFGGGHFVRSTFSWPGAALMMGAAFAIGALAAWPAQRRGDNKVAVAVSGAFGPLVVAAAYFLATPKLVGAQADDQLSAFLLAPYAVIAGLFGSVLLAGIAAQRELRADHPGVRPRTPDDPWPASDSHQGATDPDTDRDPGTDAGDRDLAADGYAPASAYSAETPALTAAGEGRTPLWPDTESPTVTPQPRRGRKR